MRKPLTVMVVALLLLLAARLDIAPAQHGPEEFLEQPV